MADPRVGFYLAMDGVRQRNFRASLRRTPAYKTYSKMS
jgi:hypothetical protein